MHERPLTLPAEMAEEPVIARNKQEPLGMYRVAPRRLEERVRNFQDQLRAFRERERAMNEALVSAQQLRDDTKDAAEREAKLIVREAQGQAADILAEARRVENDIRESTRIMERQFQSYMAGFRALLERQLSELDALEHQNAYQEAGEPEE